MTTEGNSSGMTASNFRFIIGLVFIIVVSGLIAGYYFGSGLLTQQAEDVKTYLNSNSSSVNNSASVLKYKSVLENNSNLQTKITGLSAPLNTYRDQLTTILQSYASKSGLGIDSISYETTSASRADARTATVKFNTTSVVYDNLLKFLTYIESTSPKINVSKINLSVDSSTASGSVKIDSLILEVFVK